MFFIPAMVAFAALVLGRDRRLLLLPAADARWPVRLAVLPLVLYSAYLAAGALTRLPWIYQVRPGVRSAAIVALIATAVVYLTWRRLLAG